MNGLTASGWWSVLAGVALAVPHASAGELLFDRDIRPILSENCYLCHGVDAAERQADLRLDLRESAVEHGAIVPGNRQESLLVERITSDDEYLRMPPADSNHTLTDEEIEKLIRWIEQGAEYDTLWSFKPVARPAIPRVDDEAWAKNDIDRFVLSRLEQEGMQPNPRAPLPTLLRRISLDLTGLPPTETQLEQWLAASEPLGVAIEELLASSAFGERMASDWLDVARYADTHGFNNDSARTMWPWRDWVVKAFNNNLPYDQFIVQQLAGDLLEEPTLDLKVATGFSRNHPINSEGGIINEEYRVEYVADRVRTTSLAWLGLTLDCARCHDHKYDPISQREYYEVFAFFNHVNEFGEDGRVANASPLIQVPSDEQQQRIEELKQEEVALRREIDQLLSESSSPESAVSPPEESNLLPEFKDQVSLNYAEVPTEFPVESSALEDCEAIDTSKGWSWSAWVKTGERASQPLLSTMNYQVPDSAESYGRGVEIRLTPTGAVEVRSAVRWPAYSTNVVSTDHVALDGWSHVAVLVTGKSADGIRIFIDGVEAGTVVQHDGQEKQVNIGGQVRIGHSNAADDENFRGQLQHLLLLSGPIDEGRFEELLVKESGQHSFSKSDEQEPAGHELESKWRETRRARLALERSLPTLMVMEEMPSPRPTHVLERGLYDQPGEQVSPDVPTSIGLPFSDDLPRNRLGLAKWLIDPQQPLTSRVVVNRLWQQFFGVGIVKTLEDFGMQSDWPSHPELIDWLAAEFMDSGWDVKHLVRLIVESATYQQDSSAPRALWEQDPENRLLARGPRQRLTAEMIRDQALAVSGLLHDKQGGPPVFPYQPEGFYKGTVVEAGYPGTVYTVSEGEDLYRRSLYMFWKRTVLHPTLATFDAPDREFCTAQRLMTNTPLQSLVLMNDPIFLEASRKLGERMLTEGGKADEERLAWGFQRVTARQPDAGELKVLIDLLEQQRRDFAGGVSDPESVLQAGEAPVSEDFPPAELAAYASLGSLLLNLDETITRN